MGCKGEIWVTKEQELKKRRMQSEIDAILKNEFVGWFKMSAGHIFSVVFQNKSRFQ